MLKKFPEVRASQPHERHTRKKSPESAVPISLRPISPDDEAFLLNVYAGTRTDELAHLPWDEKRRDEFLTTQLAAQQEHYERSFPEGDHRVILLDDQPIGRVYVARRDEEIRILDISVLPEHRNAGIGTSLLKQLLSEAATSGKPVRVYVETFNRSLRLFERLGFSRIETSGFHVLMEWRPGS